MLDGLQQEIDSRPELSGASKHVIIDDLNTIPSTAERWVVSEEKRLVPKGDMLAMLSFDSQVKFSDWLCGFTTEAKTFSLFYNAHDQFKTSDPVFRGTIQLLCDPLCIITEGEQNAILRLGERRQTRAEELFGRKITMEDFDA